MSEPDQSRPRRIWPTCRGFSTSWAETHQEFWKNHQGVSTSIVWSMCQCRQARAIHQKNLNKTSLPRQRTKFHLNHMHRKNVNFWQDVSPKKKKKGSEMFVCRHQLSDSQELRFQVSCDLLRIQPSYIFHDVASQCPRNRQVSDLHLSRLYFYYGDVWKRQCCPETHKVSKEDEMQEVSTRQTLRWKEKQRNS